MKFKISIFNNVVLFFFLYLSLIIGYFYDESLNPGITMDWKLNTQVTNSFYKNFLDSFLNYDDFFHRHSPVYYIFLSLFLDMGFDLNQVRFINLHLCILLVVIFYMCLKLKFRDVNKNHLISLSLLIFLSPTFRTLSIWPDSRMPGLIFFALTIYFFLKFKKTDNIKYTWYTCTALIISSYISPNFSVFFPYFFFSFLKKFNFYKLSLLLIFNFFLALPVFYYVFILDVDFLKAVTTTDPLLGINEDAKFIFNFSDKIMIISSIIFFHLSPIIILNNFYNPFLKFLFNKSIVIFLLLACLIYFFNYQLNYTGGGVFFILSNVLFDNSYLFFILSFLSVGFTMYIASLNFNNFFLISLLIISNIQNTIYHKYYEPLVMIIFFTLISEVNTENLLKNKKTIYYFYALSFIFILMRIIKNINIDYFR